ncbi:hypothetical protein DM806_09865 [Sphingobium lactosutens]|uniref:alpha/beta hydrolase family protein n=1 Tax=Sphingobium lactosutens TaxID=522773 RepID=UPI0015C037C8|nr:alpha/beta fold hydrolase [Sphingobium lactosutens]NWK95975.1 hypothetical protein [Sphingobium lactosutens]
MTFAIRDTGVASGDIVLAEEPIVKPSFGLALLEPARAFAEFGALLMNASTLLNAPRGDGHSVIVLPGFGASDLSMAYLRHFINFLGYRSVAWHLGRNMGYQSLGPNTEELRKRFEDVASKSGGRVSLVGWSLGGVMARHMARDYPELVRRVVTLAAPFTGDPAATSIRAFYEMLSGEDFESLETQALWQANRAAPSVPTTSIYTRSDGITAWRNCLETESDLTENAEVIGSHLGLPYNIMAYRIVAERLALPDCNPDVRIAE